jgi:hypothetical protein
MGAMRALFSLMMFFSGYLAASILTEKFQRTIAGIVIHVRMDILQSAGTGWR